MRVPISYDLREKVLQRDKYICRYCGNKNGPFHLDHVYPVIKGGETTYDNLVTACVQCNARKHASVGIWPKPIGYFEKNKFRKFYLFMSPIILGFLITVLFINALSETNETIKNIEITLGLLGWIPLLKELLPTFLGRE